jgi:carbonic anhydrase/acetyltransferase-like protein (isoleucine patch superfamily)
MATFKKIKVDDPTYSRYLKDLDQIATSKISGFKQAISKIVDKDPINKAIDIKKVPEAKDITKDFDKLLKTVIDDHLAKDKAKLFNVKTEKKDNDWGIHYEMNPTSVIYDDSFTSTDMINFDVTMNVSPTTKRLDIIFGSPINMVLYLPTKESETTLDVVQRAMDNIDAIYSEIVGILKNNKNEFTTKYSNLISDFKALNAVKVNESISSFIQTISEEQQSEVNPDLNKKYRLTNNKRTVKGEVVYQIEAIKSFGDVSLGTKGGYVASEKNLDQFSDSWVADNAVILGGARVLLGAKVSGSAIIKDSAQILGKKTTVSGEAIVGGKTFIRNDEYPISISEDASIFIDGEIRSKYGEVNITDKAELLDNLYIYGNVNINEKAKIHSIGKLTIYGTKKPVYISGSADVSAAGKIVAGEKSIKITGKSKIADKFSFNGSGTIMDINLDGEFDFSGNDLIVTPETVGEKTLIGSAKITSTKDFQKVKPVQKAVE